jgi:hypothetical protein
VLTPPRLDLYIKGGFKPGWIYEFIYETEGSRVMNLGFLGIRDLLSLLRYDTHDATGNPNPLAGHVEKVYSTGASLSGRVIREYVYEGWNVDAAGRRVFDAVHTHTGSGRLFQNQRFAQVGRYPRQHEEHQWPAEYYPFTFVAVPDPFTGRNEGLWQRSGTDPLVIHLHTEGDYWVRHVSLTHTDPRDASDVEIPANARMYHLTGAPHMVRALDDPDWIGQLTPNAISAIPFRRAVLVLLDRWATHGTPPPPSLLPKAADGTLVTAEEVLARYPRVPGVNLPEGSSRLPRYNYGPDFDRHGIMSVFPPQPFPGQEYPLRMPQIDADGNTIAGLRYPGHRGAAGHIQRLVPAQGRLRRGRTMVEHRQLPAIRPHQGRARGARRPPPLDRGALPEPRRLHRGRDAGVRGSRARGPDAAGRRRPLHRRGAAEEPARRLRPAWTADSGRRLHRPLGTALFVVPPLGGSGKEPAKAGTTSAASDGVERPLLCWCPRHVLH